jgi:hypothetical protein
MFEGEITTKMQNLGFFPLILHVHSRQITFITIMVPWIGWGYNREFVHHFNCSVNQ